MKRVRSAAGAAVVSLLLLTGCGDSSSSDPSDEAIADDGGGFTVGSESDEATDADDSTNDDSSDDSSGDDSTADDSSGDDSTSSDDSTADDSAADDSSDTTEDDSTDDSSDDSSADGSTNTDDSTADDSTADSTEPSDDDSTADSEADGTSADDSGADDSNADDDATEFPVVDPVPLADGFQAVNVENINFQLPDDFIVIQDADELAELLSSDEFRAGLEQIDLEQIQSQLSIVDLIAIQPTAGTFATNMNVIIAPVPGFVTLDALITQNRTQLDQVGFNITDDQTITTRAGETWRLDYTIPNTEATVASALWLIEGAQVQVTASATTQAEAQALLNGVLETVS